MNHKWIMALLIVGFCLIFVASLLGSISWFYVSRAETQYRRDDIDEDEYYNAVDLGDILIFIEQLLRIAGGLLLSVFSTVGAFIIEDKYGRLGLLLFSALVTVFVLTDMFFRVI